MKIKLTLEVSQGQKIEAVNIDDLGHSKESWDKLSESKKHDELYNYVNNMPDQPYWVIEDSE
jgi:hypothetical protein